MESAFFKMKTSFLFIFFIFWPRSTRDLSSPTRDQTRTPCSGSLNHWTSREVLGICILNKLPGDSYEPQHWKTKDLIPLLFKSLPSLHPTLTPATSLFLRFFGARFFHSVASNSSLSVH